MQGKIDRNIERLGVLCSLHHNNGLQHGKTTASNHAFGAQFAPCTSLPRYHGLCFPLFTAYNTLCRIFEPLTHSLYTILSSEWLDQTAPGAKNMDRAQQPGWLQFVRCHGCHQADAACQPCISRRDAQRGPARVNYKDLGAGRVGRAGVRKNFLQPTSWPRWGLVEFPAASTESPAC